MSDKNITLLHNDLTETIISCFYSVYNTLGFGFLEKVYENAMLREMEKRGLKAQSQYPIRVFYDGFAVGDYYADIVVEGKVIIELKASASIINDHILQLQNYLKATDFEVGLLLNFGTVPQVRRKEYKNMHKPNLINVLQHNMDSEDLQLNKE
ncbi:MAG: GxxExxY protein [Candidatus Cloacimonadaceae bacterium]|jgi:GxxExxY protein|nr:GxxExxY protein [Candidatus Cloacimonadota bacterium]MDX9948993.1 GxxExxY protein [Candidatus Syntrophosphaera sp.]